MLKASWFNLPPERELTLIKINKEVDECTSIEELRESVKSLAYQNARFQNMIGELLKETLGAEMEIFLLEEGKMEEGPAKD